MLMMVPRQEYEDEEEEYYYYDYEPESSCPPGELEVQVVFPLLLPCLASYCGDGENYSIWILGGLRG